MKFVIDCLGGDNSPRANVLGALRTMEQHADLSVIFAGDKPAIVEELRAACAQETMRERIEILHAPDAISGEDKPTDAIRLKKDSSMVRAFQILRDDPAVSALVSNGSTGALVAGATLRIGRLPGIRRPAFCPILPAMTGGIVGVCDSGANVDILPEQLQQFAIMGSRYLECAFGIEKPRVALLNIGVETEKGDNLRKTAYPLLESTPGINFVGNMESRDLLSGSYDLIVCDGFAGNVLIKTAEGVALELMKKLKRDICRKNRYKAGALLMKKMFREEKEFFNYQNYGGSVMLGTVKTVVKGHGSSGPDAFARCVEQAYSMQLGGMNEKIAASMAALKAQQEA